MSSKGKHMVFDSLLHHACYTQLRITSFFPPLSLSLVSLTSPSMICLYHSEGLRTSSVIATVSINVSLFHRSPIVITLQSVLVFRLNFGVSVPILEAPSDGWALKTINSASVYTVCVIYEHSVVVCLESGLSHPL